MKTIIWAQRVSPEKIIRLYESDAKGILDHDLLQDVGYSFLARAESIIATNRIHLQGLFACPECNVNIKVNEDNMYLCKCGWQIRAKDLHLTYKGKQFIGPSIVDFAKGFIKDWNSGRNDPVKQMFAIDYLIHRFHWEMTEAPTRPVAINYIEGSLTQIKDLILTLAYGYNEESQKNIASWKRNNAISQEIWSKKDS